MSFGQALPYAGGVVNSQLLLSATPLNRKSPVGRHEPPSSAQILPTPASLAATVSGHAAAAASASSDISVETLRLLTAGYGLPPHLANPSSLEQIRAFPHGFALGFYPTLGNLPSVGQMELKTSTDAGLQSVLSHQSQSLPAYFLDPTLTASYQYATDRFTSPLDLNAARRKNATRETTAALKAWLYEHRKNPYPTKGEKIMLAIITKMSLTQVSTWFANARRRLKKENKMTWSPRNRSEEDDDVNPPQTTIDGAGSDVSALEEALNRPRSSTSPLGQEEEEEEEDADLDDEDDDEELENGVGHANQRREHGAKAQDDHLACGGGGGGLLMVADKESLVLGDKRSTEKSPSTQSDAPAAKKPKIWSIVEDTVMTSDSPNRSSSAAATHTEVDVGTLSSFNHWQQLAAAASMYQRLPQLGPIPGVIGYPFPSAIRPEMYARLPPPGQGASLSEIKKYKKLFGCLPIVEEDFVCIINFDDDDDCEPFEELEYAYNMANDLRGTMMMTDDMFQPAYSYASTLDFINQAFGRFRIFGCEERPINMLKFQSWYNFYISFKELDVLEDAMYNSLQRYYSSVKMVPVEKTIPGQPCVFKDEYRIFHRASVCSSDDCCVLLWLVDVAKNVRCDSRRVYPLMNVFAALPGMAIKSRLDCSVPLKRPRNVNHQELRERVMRFSGRIFATFLNYVDKFMVVAICHGYMRFLPAEWMPRVSNVYSHVVGICNEQYFEEIDAQIYRGISLKYTLDYDVFIRRFNAIDGEWDDEVRKEDPPANHVEQFESMFLAHGSSKQTGSKRFRSKGNCYYLANCERYLTNLRDGSVYTIPDVDDEPISVYFAAHSEEPIWSHDGKRFEGYERAGGVVDFSDGMDKKWSVREDYVECVRGHFDTEPKLMIEGEFTSEPVNVVGERSALAPGVTELSALQNGVASDQVPVKIVNGHAVDEAPKSVYVVSPLAAGGSLALGDKEMVVHQPSEELTKKNITNDNLLTSEQRNGWPEKKMTSPEDYRQTGESEHRSPAERSLVVAVLGSVGVREQSEFDSKVAVVAEKPVDTPAADETCVIPVKRVHKYIGCFMIDVRSDGVVVFQRPLRRNVHDPSVEMGRMLRKKQLKIFERPDARLPFVCGFLSPRSSRCQRGLVLQCTDKMASVIDCDYAYACDVPLDNLYEMPHILHYAPRAFLCQMPGLEEILKSGGLKEALKLESSVKKSWQVGVPKEPPLLGDVQALVEWFCQPKELRVLAYQGNVPFMDWIGTLLAKK